MEDNERLIKGIWIPIEVWKDENLSWNEKILLMEIDSYTSEDKDCFFSNEYIAKLLGISETYANKLLSALISKGYVTKTRFDGRRRYVRTNICYKKLATYSANQPCTFVQPCLAAECNPPIYIDTNNSKDNTLINKSNKIEKEIDKSIPQKNDDLFEKCWVAYKRKGVKKTSKAQWERLSNSDKEKVLPHIRAYVSTREIQYQKDFERYLRDKLFNEVVYDKNQIIYDPMRSVEYMPMGFGIYPNDQDKCFYYVGNYSDGDKMFDGYMDDERPDGAQIRLNNGRGTITWNKEQGKWIWKRR